jgi:Na+/melibiose symporter-like transporter
MSQPVAPPRASVYRDGNFRRFWIAVTVSGMGSHITLLAMPLAAVLTLHASATQLGLLAAFQYVPVLFVTPFAGVMADVFPVKLTNALADLLRGVVLLAVPVLAWLDQLTIVWLYLLALLLGCLKSVADVAHHSMLPHIVADDELVAGNSAVNTSYSVTNVAGPGLGGLLIQAINATTAILLDAISFFVSAGLIGSLRMRAADHDEAPQRPRWLVMVREGFTYLFRDRRLLSLGLLSGMTNLFLTAFTTILVFYAVTTLSLSTTVLGIVFATGAVGGVLGSNAAKRVGDRLTPPTAMLAALVVVGTGVAALALAALVTGGPARAAILIAGTLVLSAGEGVYNVHAMSTRQSLAKREMLGRVTASYRLMSHGAMPLGALLGGVFGEKIGAGPTIGVAGLVIAVGAAVLFLTPFRRLQSN